MLAAHNAPGTDPGSSAYRKVFWRITPLLLICYMVNYLDRVNIGFAKLQMLPELGIGDGVFAVGASVFFWGYVVFEVPSNLILQRVGARFWIARIMLTWGIVSIATMFTANLAGVFGVGHATMFYVLRFLLGVCEAGFYPGVIFYINQWVPSTRQSGIIAWFGVALPISLVVGSPLSGWLMETTQGGWGYSGWQWMLLVEGVPALILAVVVLLRLPDAIATSDWLTAPEKRALESSLQAENRQKTYRFGQAVLDYRLWLMVLVVLTYNTGFYGLSFWLPSIIRAAGVQGTLAIGVLSAIPFVAAGITMVLNAAHSNRTGERRWHAVVPALFGGAGLLLSAVFAANVPVAIVCLSVAASGMLGLTPVFWTYPGRLLSGSAAAAGIALLNCLGSLSGITGSLITGLVKDATGDINDGTYVLACSLFLTAVLIFALPKQAAASRDPYDGAGPRDEAASPVQP